MPIPLGRWSISRDGVVGALNISNVDANGNVSGMLRWPLPNRTQETESLDGVAFWNDDERKLTFMRITGRPQKSFQAFTGYLLYIEGDRSKPAITGFFEAFSDTIGTAKRSVFGWYARYDP
jgi:hypothetical protein